MNRIGKFLLFSILLHILLWIYGKDAWEDMQLERPTTHKKMTVVKRKLPQQEPLVEKEKEPPEEQGQIVELPKPLEEAEPEKADYLAEYAQKTPEETAAKNYTINPEVIAPEYSIEHQIQFEEAIDVNATEPSSGAKVGNRSFKPQKDGSLFSLPSPYAKTNKDGLDKPTLASSTSANLSGAPSNDLLNEKKSNRTELNAHAYKYASYMNQIRRLVNFYWQQNIDNLQVPLYKQSYETVVEVTISATGELLHISVLSSSGEKDVDLCVTKAFELAAPFPEPPPLLVTDNVVHLPDFGFTLQVTSGAPNYNGVDPRAGVRFPGILKAPY